MQHSITFFSPFKAFFANPIKEALMDSGRQKTNVVWLPFLESKGERTFGFEHQKKQGEKGRCRLYFLIFYASVDSHSVFLDSVTFPCYHLFEQSEKVN